MIKVTRSIVLSVYAACFANLGFAAEPADLAGMKYYDVEIIVFKNEMEVLGQEINLPTPSASRTPETLDLSSPASIQQAESRGFTPLKLEQLQLSGMVDRILKSSKYSLLTHTGWRQPGLEETQTLSVWIKGGRVFDSNYSSIDQITASSQSETQEFSSQGSNNSAQVSGNVLYELEGLITITLSRYLHTKAQLVLRRPADAEVIMQQSDELAEDLADIDTLQGKLLLNYGLNEQRRMRSKKLHYLDHPNFGMLVLITPYEAPEDTSTPENPDSLGQG